MFNNLFSPITINSFEVKNRIAYPALGLMYSYDKKLNDRHLEFYRERARGGAGIVTVGPIGFDELGSGFLTPNIGPDEAVASFSRLAKAIKDEGAAAWVQLYHAGAYMYSIMIDNRQAIAPSAIYSRYTKETPREMTIEDIKEVQESFVRGALHVKEAGFDGVELIGSAGYLISQFWSPLKNQRKDEYGGSFENRGRFARETIEMIREKVGPDYPLTIRMAGNDFVPGSNTDRDMPAIAQVYEKSGIDAINVTGGWHEARVPQLSMELPRGGFSYLALNIKRAVNLPVMASNRIPDPFTAEKIIKDGMADMVNLGRVLIADPFWPKKAREGRVNEIRPCVSCSQGCTDEIFSGRPVFCVANSRAGFEGQRHIEKAAKPLNVIVIGAGPAGMEAAYRAAEAGHHVELYEKKDEIGGQLWIAGTPPHKQELWELIRFYDTMLDKYEVDVFLEQDVDLDFIREKKPDFIIVAEGAEPMQPPIEGIDDDTVIDAWTILEEDPKIGTRVAVIGGGAVGLEVAEFIASKGTIDAETSCFLFRYNAEDMERIHELQRKGTKEVTVFEMMPKMGTGVGKSTKWILLGNIDALEVESITAAKVTSIKNGAITFERDGKVETRTFDTIVNAAGSRSVRRVSEVIGETGIPFATIGDCVEPRQINHAIHEGYLAVMNLSDL